AGAARAPVAEPVGGGAAAAPPHEPAVEAPTEELSELRRRIAAMDEPEGEEEEAAEGEAVDASAAEHEDAPTAEGAGLPDEPIEAAEVESPPILPVALDEGRP